MADIYLIEARRRRRYTQATLALRVGCHQSAISKLENNRKADPNHSLVLRLRAALRLPRGTELLWGRPPYRVLRPSRSDADVERRVAVR